MVDMPQMCTLRVTDNNHVMIVTLCHATSSNLRALATAAHSTQLTLTFPCQHSLQYRSKPPAFA